MVKIIETNLILNENNEIKDHQSRVIEMESWDDYVDEFINPKYKDLKDCLGHLNGAILLKSMKVSNLEYNNFTLSCDCVRELDVKNLGKDKKIAYLIL